MQSPEEAAQVLRAELPVRHANRIAQMDELPSINRVQSLACARARMVRSFKDVLDASKREDSPQDFGHVVSDLQQRHRVQVQRLLTGMQELKALRIAQGEPRALVVRETEAFLNRFFLSRIGIEMLNSHFLAVLQGNERGIFDPSCDPCAVVTQAAMQVRQIAALEFEAVPEVEVSFHGNPATRSLPLNPQYLRYIVIELMKNSVRAVCERHEAGEEAGEAPPPAIQVHVSSDEQQTAINIADRGGGIPFEHQRSIWSFSYSTKRAGPEGSLPLSRLQTPLCGYGVGVPLSKLYAEYLGGSLHLLSMPHFGTQAFLHLQRSKLRSEGIPRHVDYFQRRRLMEARDACDRLLRDASEAQDLEEAKRIASRARDVRHELLRLEERMRPAFSPCAACLYQGPGAS